MRRLKQTGKSNEAEQELLSASFFSDKCAFSLGPKDAHFHSAQKMCIFSWPKRCTFSLGPKDLCFQSAKNIYISTQPKRYTVGLAQQMPVFTRPKICMFSANLQSVQASAFSFNQISSRSCAFAFSRIYVFHCLSLTLKFFGGRTKLRHFFNHTGWIYPKKGEHVTCS